MIADHWLAATLGALWVTLLVTVVLRFLDSKRLSAYTPVSRGDAPPLSVVIPARNESRNIEACVRSVLTSDYPRLEVIVVDDHSTDGTGEIARRLAAEDTRLRVVAAPDLPAGWFGKQWACHTGARAASGTLLCFTDADTRHAPRLLSLSVGAMRQRGADLFTVAGHQQALTFWEKVIQPFVFSILLSRYGGLEAMSRSSKPLDKIANGQFILMSRGAYDAIGGHDAVKDHVAEDLRLAQLATARGLQAHMLLARDELQTRMYTSLAEIRRGWGKNVYAAGRDTMPLNAVTGRIFPWIFPLPALMPVLPLLCLTLGLAGVWGPGALVFGAIAAPATLLFYAGVYGFSRLNPLWALLYPLAAVTFSWICAEAAWRGSKVEWKGRGYVSRRAT
ncbi:glycosyltransferase [Pseudogemmatithrix spongiicola]|uniref:Glycosyltransferase n=1 Tax=Pseudogemmatithrix spongiicola TaxID=3062599 RepID=A0AA49JWC2_9BACT|nr:glycosyltransferase [Gemmatimonadaceae bacterium 'strain 138']WKW16138.1 glycosyltransferase [Gemmatimonadaceae bacterium 'strain 318']